MRDGRTFVFEAGVLTEIQEAQAGEGEEMEALKAENEGLKKQLAEVQNSLKASRESEKAVKAKAEQEVKNIAEMFDAFKTKFSGEKPEDNLPPETPEGEPKKKLNFKFK